MANSLDAQHISTNLANYEAARTGFFSLIVDNLDNIIKATYSGDHASAPASDKIATAQETLKLNVLTADVPHFELNVLEYKRGNETVRFAGTPTFNAGSIKVDDVVGIDTKSILMAWQGLAFNVHTRKGGRMVDYKRDCTLIEYTQDYEQVRSWTLYGCWISALSEDAFDRENDGKRAITATVQYDRAVMNEAE
jgi:hypothetical protein